MATGVKKDLPVFTQCPGCSFNLITGEGTRGCAWFDCAYLPEEYKVFCPECNYNFLTREGDPHCSDPPTCEWAREGFKHAGNVRRATAAGRFA
ncbi:MAG TPA: hypothetical protein VGB83_04135 [Actinomycetota bacterium]